MARTTSDGVPAKQRADTSPEIYAKKLTNRTRALIDQALDGLDPVEFGRRFRAQLMEDPFRRLRELVDMLPKDEAPNTGAPGVAFNVQSMFLEATKIANGHGTAAPIIDVTPQEPAEGW